MWTSTINLAINECKITIDISFNDFFLENLLTYSGSYCYTDKFVSSGR